VDRSVRLRYAVHFRLRHRARLARLLQADRLGRGDEGRVVHVPDPGRLHRLQRFVPRRAVDAEPARGNGAHRRQHPACEREAESWLTRKYFTWISL